MKYFWTELLRKPFEKENKKYFGLLTTGAILHHAAREYFKLKEETGAPSLTGICHIVTTVFGKYGIPEKKYIDQFDNAEDLGDALESTSNIPFLMKKSFFT